MVLSTPVSLKAFKWVSPFQTSLWAPSHPTKCQLNISSWQSQINHKLNQLNHTHNWTHVLSSHCLLPVSSCLLNHTTIYPVAQSGNSEVIFSQEKNTVLCGLTSSQPKVTLAYCGRQHLSWPPMILPLVFILSWMPACWEWVGLTCSLLINRIRQKEWDVLLR